MAEPEDQDRGGRINMSSAAKSPGGGDAFFNKRTRQTSAADNNPPPLPTTTTTNDKIQTKTKNYDSIIIGMGPVGLVCAIAAIERGEKVALVTDRDIHKGLGVRQQVLGVDEVMDWVSSLVRPELLASYQRTNRVRRTMYQPKDPHSNQAIGQAYPYWYFSIGALEELLVDELDARIKDQLNTTDKSKTRDEIGIDIIKIARVSTELSNGIDLTQGVHSNQQGINQQKLHETIDISSSNKMLTLGGIEHINGIKVADSLQKQSFYFHDLVAANGTKQQTEKAMADKLSGDNVHLTQPCYKSHVATVFAIKGTTTFSQQNHAVTPQKLNAPIIDLMVEHCKINKHETQPVAMSELRKFGWKLPSRPHQQVYATGADTLDSQELLYIGCEYPENLKPEHLKNAINLALAARGKNQDSLEIKRYLELPEAIRAEIEKHTLQLPNFSDRDCEQLSSQLARKWSRLLLSDALPKEICTSDNICDPQYKAQEHAKEVLSTSRFDLKFFELGQSLSILGSRENGRGAFISMGDSRMFPLYTTGTGAQTGLKLCRVFHQAKEKYNAGIKQLTPNKVENHQEEIEQLTHQIYSEYHARSRAEIDGIRSVQAQWIESRNERQQKAQNVFEVIQDARALKSEIDKVMAACNEVSGICHQKKEESQFFVKSTFAADLLASLKEQGVDSYDQSKITVAMNAINKQTQTAKETLHRFYTQFNDHTMNCYEDLPRQALGYDCEALEYSQNLKILCSDLHQLHDLVAPCKQAMDKNAHTASKSLFNSIDNATKALGKLVEHQQFKKYLAKESISRPTVIAA